MTEDEKDVRDQQRWEAEMVVKRQDLWLKAGSALAVVAGILVALWNSVSVLRSQQHLFQASDEREWARQLFDSRLSLYSRLAAVAFKLKEAKDTKEAADNLGRLRDLQAEASLVIPSQMMFAIDDARRAAERFIESGERDQPPKQDIDDAQDLGSCCSRIITECRVRILHAESLEFSEQEKAENAVSTAYGSIEGGAEVIRRRYARQDSRK